MNVLDIVGNDKITELELTTVETTTKDNILIVVLGQDKLTEIRNRVVHFLILMHEGNISKVAEKLEIGVKTTYIWKKKLIQVPVTKSLEEINRSANGVEILLRVEINLEEDTYEDILKKVCKATLFVFKNKTEVAKVLGVCTKTIYNWFNAWEVEQLQ